MSNKVKSYVDEVIARFKGDDAEVVAIRNKRTAEAEVKYQLAALESRKLKAENNLEQAEENFKNALYPTVLISDGDAFCGSLKYANKALETAQEELDDVNHSIEFFTEILAKINA